VAAAPAPAFVAAPAPPVAGPVPAPAFCLLFLYLVATSKRYYPKCSARQIPASLPLGSMRPCKRSQMESTSPVFSLAEVPPTVAAFLDTYNMVFSALSLILRII